MERAEELRARFLELAPEGFEEIERDAAVELVAYGAGAERVLEAFPDAAVGDVAPGWEDRWREFHEPVRIGQLWVGAPWHTPDPGALPIVIDPGRAFGTGAHPTTRLCLELLLDEPRGSVLDLGCGSGVVGIAAARLGFAPVLAIDIDPTAVEVTRENATANGVEIEASQGDGREDSLPLADLVVANIALGAVEAIAPRLAARRAVMSGYLVADLPELPGWSHLERRLLGDWAADLFERR